MTRIAAAVLFVVCVAVLGSCSGDKNTVDYPLHQVQLGHSRDTNGDFFLIAGGVGSHENAYYYFYVESPDGTVKLHKDFYDDVTLRLVPDSTKPFIRCRGKIGPKHKFNFDRYDTATMCVFNVPEDAIGNEVNLNVKNLK